VLQEPLAAPAVDRHSVRPKEETTARMTGQGMPKTSKGANMKCIECGFTMKVTREDIDYEPSKGLVVRLHDIEIGRDTNGHVVRSIYRIGPLHREIAAAIVRKPGRMTGPEFRYLRSHLGYQAKDLATILGATAAGVSRWENGHEPIGPQTDRLMRLLVVSREPLDGFAFEQLAAIEKKAARPLELELRVDGDEWRPAA
jgi:DNA-binding transcriptional regulator YiaG